MRFVALYRRDFAFCFVAFFFSFFHDNGIFMLFHARIIRRCERHKRARDEKSMGIERKGRGKCGVAFFRVLELHRVAGVKI